MPHAPCSLLPCLPPAGLRKAGRPARSLTILRWQVKSSLLPSPFSVLRPPLSVLPAPRSLPSLLSPEPVLEHDPQQAVRNKVPEIVHHPVAAAGNDHLLPGKHLFQGKGSNPVGG